MLTGEEDAERIPIKMVRENGRWKVNLAGAINAVNREVENKLGVAGKESLELAVFSVALINNKPVKDHLLIPAIYWDKAGD